ncbi:MAG: ABC transporter substrate-binding protein [Candidatus Bipolaricaulaceae bacterium]
MRKLLSALAVFLLSFPATAQLSVVDQAGREVAIPGLVERVVSLYGVATLHLYALDAQDKLVLGTYVGMKPGSPSWDALREIDPSLGDRFMPREPSLEEVLAARPDLVVGSAHKDRQAAEALGRFGVPVVLLSAEDVAGMKEATVLLGKVLGAAERAAALTAYLDSRLHLIAAALAAEDQPAPRTLFVGTAPLRVASGDMYQSEMIALAGGASVTEELSGHWQDVNIEQVLLWDPDVVFIAPYGGVRPADLTSDPVWQGVTAVSSGRVFKLPRVFSPWDVPTPESALGMMWMAKRLHPQLPLDVVGEAQAFYYQFYGFRVPEGLLAEIAG